jgi:hypothetical protein
MLILEKDLLLDGIRLGLRPVLEEAVSAEKRL